MESSENKHDMLPLVRHRTNDIAMQFPDALDANDLDSVAPRIARVIRAADALRRIPLDNADEPAPVFRPIGKEQL